MLADVIVDAIVLDGDKVLLVKNADVSHLGWLLPGGGIEKGETLEQAIVRELKEECNVDIKVERVVTAFVSKESLNGNFNKTYVVVGLLTKALNNVIKTDASEIKEAAWFRLSELPRKDCFVDTIEQLQATGLI